MCYMIVVGLPERSRQKWVEKLPHPMRAWPAHYEGLPCAMNGFPAFIVGTSQCSCDLFHQKAEVDVAARYRRKGWSESKIHRAVADRAKSSRATGLHPEVRRWLADAASDVGEAYLFIHWDLDRLDHEQRATTSARELQEHEVVIKAEQLLHIMRDEAEAAL